MVDGFGREISYLRISVTDRCNLRCRYCMPEGRVSLLKREELLDFAEIGRLARIMAGLGIRRLRLTGGEPMARPGCLDLVGMLSGIPGIEGVSMTSNGSLLAGRLREARAAGLHGLNLSLDALDPDRYAAITRGGRVELALTALEEALEAGMDVKVNAVPVRGLNDGELAPLALLAKDRPVLVRFIELMPIGCGAELTPVPQAEVLRVLTEALGPMEEDRENRGSGPARYVKPAGFAGAIGLIGAVSHRFCRQCNRVRLTADGRLKLCLNRLEGLDLRGLLRSGADDEALASAIREAVLRKPEQHGFYEAIGDRETRRMNQIGG